MKNILILFLLLFTVIVLKAQTPATPVGSDLILYEKANKLSAGTYSIDSLKSYITSGLSNGTVLRVEGDTSNGFRSRFINPTTYPKIEMKINVTGVLKGDATTGVVSAANINDIAPAQATNGGKFLGTDGTSATWTAITNATLPTVDVGHGGTGVVTFTAGYVKSPGGTNALTTVSTIPYADITVTDRTIPIAKLVASAVYYSVDSSTATNFGLERDSAVLGAATTRIYAPNATTTIKGLLSAVDQSIGGVKTFARSAVFTSGYTANGKVTNASTIVKTPGAAITASGSLAATDNTRSINSTSNITISVPTANDVGTEIVLPLETTSTGQVVINSSGSETFNGGSSYTVYANSQGTTITLRKVSPSNYRASLGW